jgi:acetyl-CoA C-acetyltransferase
VSVEPHTPVIIGVGQITQRAVSNETFEGRPEPLDLMRDALERASTDAGTGRRALDSLDELVAIGSFTWHPRDPALLLAEGLSLKDVRTRLTPTGGNLPQKLIHESARRIQRGELTTIGVVGAEAMYTRSLARREGKKVHWTLQGESVPTPTQLEEDRIPFTKDEYDQGLTLPVEVYPLFENARRARLGWTLDTQRERLGTLWHHFAQVAAKNPYAWLQGEPSAEDIATPSSANRMVSFPYTKLLVANLPVDMGAAYIMTSFEHATQLGVARDSMIFPQCGADANDHWYVSQRPQLDDSPAMRAVWRALRGFGVRAEDLAHIDLYSCFPTVVQSACDVLGIDAFDESRIPTLTGGLTFGGGPGNNYVTHSIASAVETLRHDPGSQALVTGLGWFSTKHSWGVYATSPPTQGFQHHDAQSDVDALATSAFAQLEGDVRIESYTVSHDREGPRRLVACARDANDVRTWCHSVDPSLMHTAENEEIIGRLAQVRAGEMFF